MSKLRVFLADDHPVFRGGLRVLIDGQPDMEVIGEAADGESASRRVVELAPDVAVLDVSMPKVGGVEAAARIRRGAPSVRVVALTAHQDASYARQMLAVGAVAFVSKVAAAHDLVPAIRTVAAGATFVDPAMVAAPPGLGVTGDVAVVGAGAGDLTEGEAEVLRRMARGQTVRGAAAGLGMEVRDVEAHRARAMSKLGLRSRAELVRYALRRGWLSEG